MSKGLRQSWEKSSNCGGFVANMALVHLEGGQKQNRPSLRKDGRLSFSSWPSSRLAAGALSVENLNPVSGARQPGPAIVSRSQRKRTPFPASIWARFGLPVWKASPSSPFDEGSGPPPWGLSAARFFVHRGREAVSVNREFRIRLPENLADSIDLERQEIGLSRAGLVKLAVSKYLAARIRSESRRGGALPRSQGAVSTPNPDTFRG